MSSPDEPEPYPWIWAAPAIGLVVATALVALLRYPHLPSQLNIHFNAAGHADRTVATTPWAVATPVLLQAGITAVLLFGVALRPHSVRPHGLPTPVKRAILVLAACIDVSLLAAAWQTWSGADAINLWPVLVPPLLGVAALITVAARTRHVHSGVGAGGSGAPYEDERNWRGPIYANRDDRALLVPKRFGIGWTLNFGNPRAWLVVAVLLALVVGIPVLSAVAGLR